MKKGIKRSLTVMMFVAIPLVSASSTSPLQELQIPIPVIMPVPAVEEAVICKKTLPTTNGTASWYSESDPFINLHTANGEIFDDTRMTCASWNFPFQTRLKITNLANGKSVICVVNDRGPAKRLGRIVDLTRSAFARIGDLRKGLVTVSVTPLSD